MKALLWAVSKLLVGCAPACRYVPGNTLRTTLAVRALEPMMKGGVGWVSSQGW